MTSPLRSLIASGTKLWLDSIDPDLVQRNRALGATGATSNPIIIADLIKTGRFDTDLTGFMRRGSRRGHRLAADRHARPAGPKGLRAGLGSTTAMTATSASSSIRSWKTRPSTCRWKSGPSNTSSWARNGAPATPIA